MSDDLTPVPASDQETGTARTPARQLADHLTRWRAAYNPRPLSMRAAVEETGIPLYLISRISNGLENLSLERIERVAAATGYRVRLEDFPSAGIVPDLGEQIMFLVKRARESAGVGQAEWGRQRGMTRDEVAHAERGNTRPGLLELGWLERFGITPGLAFEKLERGPVRYEPDASYIRGGATGG